MLPPSSQRLGLVRLQAIASICFYVLGELHFSIQLLAKQSVALKTLGGAEFQR